MDRREALKQLTLLTGGALSFSTVAGLMGGCRATNENASLQTLSPAQNELVSELTERIIPATDTPGAKDANVNQFIDHMLTNWHTKEEKQHFLEGLDHVDELSNQQHDRKFVQLSKEHKIDVLEVLQQEAMGNPTPTPNTDLKPFFSMIKELTIVGFYTSEIGATQELKFDAVRGYYNGCIPYTEDDRAWA